MNATYTAYPWSDLYNAGRSCDGQPFIAEQYYVVIENEAGRRFRHQAIFKSTQEVVCEETGESYFTDLREQAIAKAHKLAVRVNQALKAGKSLSPTFWNEIDPAYGSDEYQSQGIEAQRAFADRDA